MSGKYTKPLKESKDVDQLEIRLLKKIQSIDKWRVDNLDVEKFPGLNSSLKETVNVMIECSEFIHETCRVWEENYHLKMINQAQLKSNELLSSELSRYKAARSLILSQDGEEILRTAVLQIKSLLNHTDLSEF